MEPGPPHLDELNARAQAIRHQSRQLSDESVPVPGRPYQLHTGDHIQIRHTIQHPDHGPIRNGTQAQITSVDPRTGELELCTADRTELRLDQQQNDAADLRLAYVQHPFPAQGQTTDTTHVIIGGHTTREGSYVALTRARDHTHIYTANTIDETPDLDAIQQLAEQMSHTEPDLPSIRTPLAHETAIAARLAIQQPTGSGPHPVQPVDAAELNADYQRPLTNHDPGRRASVETTEGPLRTQRDPGQEMATDARSPEPDRADHPDLDQVRDRTETPGQRPARTWPRTPNRELPTREYDNALEHNHAVGWEP